MTHPPTPQKKNHLCRILRKPSESAREWRLALYQSDQQQRNTPLNFCFHHHSAIRSMTRSTISKTQKSKVWASRVSVAAKTAVCLTGYSDWPAGFREPLSPLYRCLTSVTNIQRGVTGSVAVFQEAVKDEDNRLLRIHDVVQQLPPPHYR